LGNSELCPDRLGSQLGAQEVFIVLDLKDIRRSDEHDMVTPRMGDADETARGKDVIQADDFDLNAGQVVLLLRRGGKRSRAHAADRAIGVDQDGSSCHSTLNSAKAKDEPRQCRGTDVQRIENYSRSAAEGKNLICAPHGPCDPEE